MAASLSLRLTGGVDNADPDLSLGGVMSTEEVSATALHNLWDDVSVTEATDGDTEYRAIDIYNGGDATAEGISIWFSSGTSSPHTDIWLGVDSGTQTIGNESTAPNNPAISFTQPLVGSVLSLDNIAASGARRIWFKRVVTALATNYANDTYGIAVRYA